MLCHRGLGAVALVAVLGVVARMPAASAAVSLDIQDAEVTAADVGSLQRLFPDVVFTDALNEQLRAPINDAMAKMRGDLTADINSRLAALEVPTCLRAMANAAASASKGSGFDYASDPSFASLTAVANGTTNQFSLKQLEHIQDFNLDTSDGRLPGQGVGAAANLSLSVPLAAFHLPRWRFFDPARLTVGASFFRIGPRTVSDYTARYSTWGLRASYRLLRPRAAVHRGLLRWGGLSLGIGISQANFDLDIKAVLPEGNQDLDVDTQPQLPLRLRLQYDGSAALAVKSRVTAVPIELWTHAQIGYLFTLYLGGALDFNSGSATLGTRGQQRSSVVAFNSDSPSLLPATLAEPRAQLSIDELGGARSVDLRGFGGLQLNLLALALFAQGGADTTGSLSASVGLRAFW